MKTTLEFTALLLAAAVPSTLAAPAFGLQLPASFDLVHVLAIYATALVALIAFADYARPKRSLTLGSGAARTATVPALANAKAQHPLAA